MSPAQVSHIPAGSRSTHRRHHEFRTRTDAGRPTGRDGLQFRIEPVAFRTVYVVAVSAGYAGGFFRAELAGDGRPDIQVHFITFSTDAMGRGCTISPALPRSACQLRPESRGYVRIAARSRREEKGPQEDHLPPRAAPGESFVIARTIEPLNQSGAKTEPGGGGSSGGINGTGHHRRSDNGARSQTASITLSTDHDSVAARFRMASSSSVDLLLPVRWRVADVA
ncbi:hypothetical protein ABIB81_004551 [Bradyrhizobium sp. I1.7.5]